jgi:hypothetical protein
MPYMLYAIIASDGKQESFHSLSVTRGIHNALVVSVAHKGLVAVLEQVDNGRVVINTGNAIRYAGIIEELHQHDDLLPARYGTVMETKDAVIGMLEQHEKELEESLRRVRNKEEFSLKVFWNYEKGIEKIRQKMEHNTPEVATPPSGEKKSTAYLLEKIKAYHFEKAVLEYAEQLCEEIRHATEAFNPDIKFKKMPSQSLLIDAVFLQKKGLKEDFIRLVRLINDRHSDFRFLLTGPWPPYSFADFK